MMRSSFKRARLSVGITFAVAILGWIFVKAMLAGAFEPGPSEGPFTSDDSCPYFKETYPSCEVLFGNSGLSVLNSVYETFVGEGAFEIYDFSVETLGEREFEIVASSNRGPLRSMIRADKIVRLGQDRENELVTKTHQSAYCDGGRIYEQQVGFLGNDLNVQDLEFWSEGERFYFRLFQGGSPTAEVVCQ